MKKVISYILVFVMVLTLATSVLADVDLGVIYNKDTDTTGEFLVDITRPDGDESTFKKSYVVCGISDMEGIVVRLLKQDANGKFVDFCDVDGDSIWEIGNSGVFMKEVTLNEGANYIRIVAYKKGEEDRLVLGNNFQVNQFTVTVLNESLKDKIKNGFINVTDMFKGLLKRN